MGGPNGGEDKKFLPEYAAYLEGTKINNIKLKSGLNKMQVRTAIRLRNIFFHESGTEFNSTEDFKNLFGEPFP